MPGELCAACSTITLPMLLEGFQHPLDYNQVLQSKDHCRLCDLVMDAYDSHDSHVYTKNGKREICNEEHRGPLVWRIVPPGPGVRSGMFCADSNHYGKTLTVSASEGMYFIYSGLVPEFCRTGLTSLGHCRVKRIPKRFHHTQKPARRGLSTQLPSTSQLVPGMPLEP